MANGLVNFCCSNWPECGAMNSISRSRVEQSIRGGRIPVGVCSWCGLVNKFTGTSQVATADWLPCLPFIDEWPTRLPTGVIPGGMYVDFEGNTFTEADFMMRNGVNPRIRLKFQAWGNPKPQYRCQG